MSCRGVWRIEHYSQFPNRNSVGQCAEHYLAALYLIVMVIYSPLLTIVALSTLPLYLLLVFGVAPLYRQLIRKRAVAQARTQSHLIEVLGGIQTVKAQHFELTARWKWQDRYRHFVTEGFKSVALGSTAGEIGKFLNQLSGLLVLWVGMWLVYRVISPWEC